MRLLSFALFFAIMVALVGGLHYYLWARLVRDPAWPNPYRKVGRGVIIGLALSIPLAMLMHRFVPRSVAAAFGSLAFVWIGTCLFLFLLLVAADAARGLGRLTRRLRASADTDFDEARRQFLARGAAGAVGAVSVAATATSIRGGLAEVEVKEVAVALPRLPAALSGLTLVQLTDVHIGPTIGRRFVESVVDKANAARPDLVVITGDLVDGSVARLARQVEPLAKLQARYGVFFTTGNHEYYSGVDAWLEHLEQMGIRTLRNERVEIGDVAGGSTIDLAGVDDTSGGRFGGGHGADVRAATSGRDPERELVLLSHRPKTIFEAAEAGVGLQVCGHTHGGQIWPFTAAVALVEPYVAGLHRHAEHTQIYVSRGTGYWGPPMRLCAPAEITKIVLTPTDG